MWCGFCGAYTGEATTEDHGCGPEPLKDED